MSRVQDEMSPELYHLVDLKKKPVVGTFYRAELRPTEKPKSDRVYAVNEVLRKRTVRGKRQYLVSFLFYPKKFNEWINEEDWVKK